MEQLIDLTKQDASKYKDVINIFLKLQGEGGIKDLSAQFDKIFKNEVKFTLQELERIEKARDEKLDLENQCENNLAIFKTSFQVIVQLLVENSFKSISQNIPEICKKRLNVTKESEEHVEFQSSTTHLTPSKILEETPKSKSKKSSISSKAKTTGKKKNKENSRRDIRDDMSPNGSKVSSVLQRIINGGSMTGTSFLSSKVSGFTQEMDRTKTSNNISALSKRSSMYHSSPRNLNLSKSFVESEFNHIKGCGTFENSKRSFFDFKETGPGPSDYNADKAMANSSKIRRSNSPTIGNAKKPSWIQQLSNTPSPGPGGLYPSHHFLSK